jgi:hypothetical protein
MGLYFLLSGFNTVKSQVRIPSCVPINLTGNIRGPPKAIVAGRDISL